MLFENTANEDAIAQEGAAPPSGPSADWTIPQHWERFTTEEHRVWDTLFARQQKALSGRVVSAFANGMELLRLADPGIPQFDRLNERLFRKTGWTVVSVPGLVPDEIFFRHLSRRQFPAGNFIRPAAQLDYLEEPDVFHDVFGHVPMLADPQMADFMQELGRLGLGALKLGAIEQLSRLYWYSVEFGLAHEDGALKIYGAGLASSFGEAAYSLQSPVPSRRPFDLRQVLATGYRSDAFQTGYFVVDGIDRLVAEVRQADLAAEYARMAA